MSDKPNITILNVDDHDGSRYTVTEIFHSATFDVIEAANGAEALRLVKENPDIVLLDVNLPDIDGFEVCARIKADPDTSLIPVLILSATSIDEQSRVKGLESGADGYLTQPLAPELLVATVKSLLRMRQAEVKARASEEKLAGIIDSVTDQMIMLDEEFNIVWANNVAKTMMGSVIIGKKCYNISHVPDHFFKNP
jgi:DNA-binding response OmpR family regulator